MRWTFGFILAAICVFIAPAVCLMWIILLGTMNWHDALMVSCVIAVQFQVYMMRRGDRQAERAMRRLASRRYERQAGWTVPEQSRTEDFYTSA